MPRPPGGFLSPPGGREITHTSEATEVHIPAKVALQLGVAGDLIILGLFICAWIIWLLAHTIAHGLEGYKTWGPLWLNWITHWGPMIPLVLILWWIIPWYAHFASQFGALIYRFKWPPDYRGTDPRVGPLHALVGKGKRKKLWELMERDEDDPFEEEE